jgi:DNA-binding CsgD family transcriptional regulator
VRSSPSSTMHAVHEPSAGARGGSAPDPTLPVGAGGPLRRAAGWVPPPAKPPAAEVAARLAPACVADPDPLRRLHAAAAAMALGFCVVAGTPGGAVAGALVDVSAATVRFIPLDEPDLCPRCGERPPADAHPGAPLLVGYGALAGALVAHRRHRCADLVLQLVVAGGGARFAQLPVVSCLDAAGVTPREADVLALVLAGAPGPAIAGRLCVSPATVRAHVRALLRKLGAPDRVTLRAQLLFAGQESPLCFAEAPDLAADRRGGDTVRG